jgi:hypothetical protein
MSIKLLDLQRRHQELGRIRSGISVEATSRAGKKYRQPKKLDTFVLSSPNRRLIEAAAVLYGGEVEAWERQWRVITPVNELPCAVPAADAAINQAFEMWSGGVCVRRCDGETEQLRQVPCMCPADPLVRADLAGRGEACKAKTRINLILPDLPGIGVWRLETGSWNAAVETAGTVALLAAARDGIGVVIPAVLRLEHRESKRLVDAGVRPDPARGIKGERAEAKDFFVPVLDVLATTRELTEITSRPLAASLPPAPDQMKAISAGQAPTPAFGVKVDPPAAWGPPAPEAPAGAPAGELPAPTAAAAPPAPGNGTERTPQAIADDARNATALAVWRSLWREADAHRWMDEYVQTAPDADAPLDVLKVFLEEQGARIAEKR